MNTILITGRLGKDPDLKTAQNGTEYTNISVAVDRRKKQDEERKTDWFRCTAFGKTAVFITTYLRKGDNIIISGSMENDPYKDKETDKLRDSWQIKIQRAESPKASKTQEDNATSAAPTEGYEPLSDDDVPF